MAEPDFTHDAALIAVDWGTSRLRAVLLDRDGRPLTEAESGDGIGALAAGEHEAAFARITTGWPNVPAIMAGMVGSRQGWHEAAYCGLPADAAALAAKLHRFEAAGRALAIVPGVMLRSPQRDGDVIRGEETQIVGLGEREPGFAGIVVLPGTHSKWATVEGGAITDFQTFLTGEMFNLLSQQSFLRHSVTDGGGDVSAAADFALGVRRTSEEGLPFLAAIFSVRARQLLDGVLREDNFAYLSGLVIGGEIAAARQTGRLKPGQRLRIIGTRSLARAYAKAFALTGGEAEVLDGTDLAIAGLLRIAEASGFVAARETA